MRLALAEKTMTGIGAINLKLVAITMAIGVAVGGAGVAGYSAMARSGQSAMAAHAPKKPAKSDFSFGNSADIKQIAELTDQVARVPKLRLDFGPDGKTLTSVGLDGRVVDWDVAALRQSSVFMESFAARNMSGTDFLDFSVHKKIMALSVADGLMLFDARAGRKLHLLPMLPPQVGRFSPDGKWVAAARRSVEEVFVWEVASGKEVGRIPIGQGFPRLAFTSDSKKLVIAYTQLNFKATKPCWHNIHVWDVATAKQENQWKIESDAVENLQAIECSPDAQFAAASVADGGIQLWDITCGKQMLRLGAAPKLPPGASPAQIALNSRSRTETPRMAFSPTGRILVGGVSLPNTSKAPFDANWRGYLWETYTGQTIYSWQSTQNTHRFAFSPDGRTMAASYVASYMGPDKDKIVLWDLTGGQANSSEKQAPLTKQELNAIWNDMAGSADKADKAIWALTFAPDQSVPLIRKALIRTGASEETIAKFVADLDSDRFAVRDKASKALLEIGPQAEGLAQKTLKGNITLEHRQRLEQFLTKSRADTIRQLRAISTLDQIRTPEAIDVLKEISKAAGQSQIGEAARAALQRAQKPRTK